MEVYNLDSVSSLQSSAVKSEENPGTMEGSTERMSTNHLGEKAHKGDDNKYKIFSFPFFPFLLLLYFYNVLKIVD